MKRLNFKIFSIGIKTFFALFLISLFSFFIVSWKTRKIADDLWQQLGLTQFEANKNINYSFLYGHFSYLGAKNAKNVAIGNRVAIINDLAAYAKKYSNSEEFKREYQNYRNNNKPAEPVAPQITPDMIRAEEKVRLEKAIKTAEAGANSPNEKIRNSVPLRLENLKKELSELEDPNNKKIKMRMDNATRSHEYATKTYNQALQKFEEKYPENPQLLIKRRLQEILNITADVDFNAELKDQNGLKLFVNPQYESKPLEWKHAFRAGKPATDAVRAIAQQWLQQLN